MKSQAIIGVLGFVICFCAPAALRAQEDSLLFPCPNNLINNVKFWEKVYSEYSVNQAVLHDADQILNIYEVLAIQPDNPHKCRAIFEDRRKHYAEILDRIAQSDVSSAEAKRVWEICGPGLTAEDYLSAKETMRLQAGQKEKYIEGLKRSGMWNHRSIIGRIPFVAPRECGNSCATPDACFCASTTL
jgi:membrane-bound lytic murein transglycosylase D